MELKNHTPLPNRNGVNTVLLANLVDRLNPSQCLQAYLRLELGGVELPLLRFAHCFSLLMVAHSLNYCLEIGVHYKPKAARCICEIGNRRGCFW